jgi:sulfite exporter TauE/SafE
MRTNKEISEELIRLEYVRSRQWLLGYFWGFVTCALLASTVVLALI